MTSTKAWTYYIVEKATFVFVFFLFGWVEEIQSGVVQEREQEIPKERVGGWINKVKKEENTEMNVVRLDRRRSNNEWMDGCDVWNEPQRFQRDMRNATFEFLLFWILFRFFTTPLAFPYTTTVERSRRH